MREKIYQNKRVIKAAFKTYFSIIGSFIKVFSCLIIAVWRILKKGCSTDFQTELKIGLREAREKGGGGEVNQ
jgi:hypothetical protein